jgi:hypothetical protein
MIYRCKQPFSTSVSGRKRIVSAGELVSDSDPVLKGRQHLFEPVEEHVQSKEEAAPKPAVSRRSPVKRTTAKEK